MTADIFGSLMEWGRVLETLDRLRVEGTLDEHQAGMARILRYRANWRLTDRVLYASLDVRQASDLLTAEVLNVLARDETPLVLRLNAARSLGHLLTHRPPQETTSFDPDRALRTLEDLAARPGSPLLIRAVEDAIEQVRAGRD